MKHLIFVFSLLYLAVGCDAPQRTRASQLYSNSYTDSNAGGGSFTPGTTGSSSGGTTGTTTGETPSPGFENCKINENKHHNIDIGWFSICQSTQDETVFKLRTSLGSVTNRICIVPTYRDQSGSSTYLGDPQCTLTEANVVVQGKLYKTRTNFQTYPINGVIVLKEGLVPEYYACMQGYINWPANACQKGHPTCSIANACPYGAGGTIGTTCDKAARSYMNEVCSAFKSKYSNAYSDLSTK